MKKNRTPLLLRLVQRIYPTLERTFPAAAHRLFVTIFFTPFNFRVPAREKVMEKQAEKFFVTVNNKTVHCYSWGTGPVVLLVHGWAGRATQFRKIITALVRANYNVVGFDGPAHGHSQGTRTHILEFAEALKLICDKVGAPRGVITHSFGGAVALCAAMNGVDIKRLINIASPVIGDDIIQTYLKAIGASAATGAAFKAHILKTYNKPFDEFTALHFIRHLPQPLDLLLIHDDDDREVGVHQAQALVQQYPKARLLRTQGLGHTRILKDEGVIAACAEFLQPPPLME